MPSKPCVWVGLTNSTGEASSEGGKLGGSEPLATERQHGMLGKRPIDPLERRPVERPRQIHTGDFGSQSFAERPRRHRQRHDQSP